MRETAWYLTDVQDNLAIAETKTGSTGQKHVVTGLYAGFSNDATAGTAVIKVNAVSVMELRFTGQITLNDLELEFADSTGMDVTVELNASGVAGVFGSVLLNGYTK